MFSFHFISKLQIINSHTEQAHVAAYNCVPPSDLLQLLFFGCMGAGMCFDDGHCHERHIISEEIHKSLQQIVFLPASTSTGIHDDTIHNDDPYGGDVMEHIPGLIDDVPVGMRLLNTYQRGYKEKLVTQYLYLCFNKHSCIVFTLFY